MLSTFNALVVRETGENTFIRRIEPRDLTDLPAGDLLIRVRYSSLNYKDALSATGNKGVTRNYPHTPGIDAAGVVEASAALGFSPGDEVIVIGFDLGMNTPGGFGEYIRIPAGWAVRRPEGLSLRESMTCGTAGFTAAMCVEKLESHGVAPDDGDMLVTGATGGVGSFAVRLLAKLGYGVHAVTGKPEQAGYLTALGAAGVLTREEAVDATGRALLSGRWAGVVDTLGGEYLATALKATRYGGAVAACGNAASIKLETTVFPFILRGVALYGIDSVAYPIERKQALWERLATDWKLAGLDKAGREVPLAEINPEIDRILAGGQVGRIVIRV
jgi:alcohol dehydrogenase